MSTDKFKCRKCGANSLEEIISGAVVAIQVSTILKCFSDDRCYCDYEQDSKEISSGRISHYQCSFCGHILSETELKLLEQNT